MKKKRTTLASLKLQIARLHDDVNRAREAALWTEIAIGKQNELLAQLIATLDDGGPLNLSPEKRSELRAMIEAQQ